MQRKVRRDGDVVWIFWFLLREQAVELNERCFINSYLFLDTPQLYSYFMVNFEQITAADNNNSNLHKLCIETGSVWHEKQTIRNNFSIQNSPYQYVHSKQIGCSNNSTLPITTVKFGNIQWSNITYITTLILCYQFSYKNAFNFIYMVLKSFSERESCLYQLHCVQSCRKL